MDGREITFSAGARAGDNSSLVNTAIELYEREEFDEALALFNEGASKFPDNKYVFYNRALVLVALGRTEEAMADYSRALVLDPQLAWAYNNRAILLADEGKYDAALEDYNRALDLEPTAKHYYNRGNCFYHFGKEVQALEDFNKAISLDVSIPEFFSNRAFCYQALHRYSEMLKDVERSLELRPDDSQSCYARAQALDKLGRIAEALKAYKYFLSVSDKRRDRRQIEFTRKRMGTIWRS